MSAIHGLRGCPRVVLVLCILTAGAASRAGAQEQRITLAGRDVVVWHPTVNGGGSGAPERLPLLIFSHGYSGCATQSRFLTEALAAHGYWVFAPNHQDANCRRGAASRATRPDESFRDPDRWSDRSFVDRADDIRAIQKAIAEHAEYSRYVDLTRIGYLGHSLGGYTVLGLAGGWSSWQVPGLKAVLALSPYTQPFLTHGTLSGISVPVMYQGGTLDFGITPALRRSGGTYEATPAPKYFVDFSQAGHLAWTDLRDVAHQQIIDYALAFLDRYVRGVQGGDLLTRATSDVAELRYQSELGTGQGGSEHGDRPRLRRRRATGGL